MSDRKAFLLRIDPAILDAVQRWANDDLRSLNGQIEFLLKRSLEARARLKPPHVESPPPSPQTLLDLTSD